MQNLPIFAKLKGRRCLVVGGGGVAGRRVEQLLAAGACVTVVAPELAAPLDRLASEGAIETVLAPFSEDHIGDHWLVVAATSDTAVNRQVAAAAETALRLCNVVDEPELCTFIMPTIIDRDPITIAVSSAGTSPVLARRIKGLIEEMLPARIGALATLAGRWRDKVRSALPDLDRRRHFWQDTLRSDIAELACAGRERDAEAALAQALAAWSGSASGSEPARRQVGQAWLVGAGPGDPGLITLRGKQLLARADAVLYDRLVNPKILEYARRDAELIPVGKQAGGPSIRQEQLNRLLVTLVASGKHVCRLKGGDPMVFGRIGEELEALTEAGLPFQIVPGVSAIEGCAAYAGIPLTMRDEARAIVIATGHTTDHAAADLSSYREGQTLALYMAVAHFEPIAARLIELGHPASLPVAVIENGTLEQQRVIRTTLAKLPHVAASEQIRSPALLLCGKTVGYAKRYAWFSPEVIKTLAADLARAI